VSTPAPHLYPDALGDDAPMAGPEQLADRGGLTRAPKTWVPKQVLITPSAPVAAGDQDRRAGRRARRGDRRAHRRPHHRAGLLGLDHRDRTRARFSVNALSVTRRFEGGTAALGERLAALRRCAQAGFPVGLTIAPVVPVQGWREEYAGLLRDAAAAVGGARRRPHRGADHPPLYAGEPRRADELDPRTKLEMDVDSRRVKRTKFGSTKYVFRSDVMRELRDFFAAELNAVLPAARVLYWT